MLLNTTNLLPHNAETVVYAACCLHNLMRERYPVQHANLPDEEDPVTHEIRPGAWRQEVHEMVPIMALCGNMALRNANLQRDYLCQYVNGRSAVEWQDHAVQARSVFNLLPFLYIILIICNITHDLYLKTNSIQINYPIPYFILVSLFHITLSYCHNTRNISTFHPYIHSQPQVQVFT